MKPTEQKGVIHRLMNGGSSLLLSSIVSSIAGTSGRMISGIRGNKKSPDNRKTNTTEDEKLNKYAAGAEDLSNGQKETTLPEKKKGNSIQESLAKLNSWNGPETAEIKTAFNEWLTELFKSDPKSNDINTHLVFYTTKKPNNRGTYISDFDIIVENEESPFTSTDQVDYFLSNYVKMVENERLPDGDPKKVDRSTFFTKIKKTFPHYSTKVKRGGKKTTRRYKKRTTRTRRKK
jgi:hypothetical protein